MARKFDDYKPGKAKGPIARRFSECKSKNSPNGKHGRTHHKFQTEDPKSGKKVNTIVLWCEFCHKLL